MKRFRRPALALAIAPLAVLAACSASAPEAPANDANVVDEGPVVDNALDTPFVNAEPLPEPTATPTPEAAATPLPDQEQIQADADATGMTARVDRSAEQPADEATSAPTERQ